MGVWGVVIFVLSMMRVVGGVPLWVVCVFRSSCKCCVFVSVVHPVAILSAVFCVICNLLMFVSDVIDDHMVGTKRIQPTRGWCATSRGTVQIVSTLSCLSGGPGPQCFGEACHATPQHG